MIEKGTGLCHSVTEANKSFRLKLTTDHIRWNSLKISPSQEFEDHILKKLDEASREVLDAWIPIEIHIIDTDIQETYRVKLVKKKSFWFEPLPDVKQKKKDKAGNEFYYSLEPFKHIVKRRNLSCDKEIGLCWSAAKPTIHEIREGNMESNVKSGSSASSGDPNPCPICLGPMVQDSYLDKCYHKFCYNCIIQWTKVVASKHSSLLSSVKCPLCKTENFSIIHGYDGTHFQRHYIGQNSGDRFIFSKAHKYRLQCYYTESGLKQRFI
ncbi:hypothetical protein Patl1_22680 [Pistacia atlantica]|uniref:Uncharacterized protein n=1 Tax=Pistacia atlantica TaxID=434234 RepID=A0ACC0ZYC4_9ROSI|nr:hypothetical protein Patl1_22680 [Pistacia atlantica]